MIKFREGCVADISVGLLSTVACLAFRWPQWPAGLVHLLTVVPLVLRDVSGKTERRVSNIVTFMLALAIAASDVWLASTLSCFSG